jgi:hypothetical protein
LQYTTIKTAALRVARVCERIVEHIAGVDDYQVALASYRAASERWPVPDQRAIIMEHHGGLFDSMRGVTRPTRG